MDRSTTLGPRRMVSWWLRFEDLNWPHPDAYDRIKRKAEAMAAADVSAAMIFGAHFRWDFLPYFTILNDYLATVSEELSKVGIELYDHHSVCLIHRYDTREEMRNVMLHSGPHLPFSPSRQAAASWEYNGSKLNSWRMIDIRTGKPVYYPQYTAESFCTRNPEYREAYKKYIKELVAETGIRGLSADDPVHFMHHATCGCDHCRKEFRSRTGVELPSVSAVDFIGNWDNPLWLAWVDMRLDGVADFLSDIKSVLPEGFFLTSCGGMSASASVNASCADGRRFLAGCNYLNLEMGGNTPPYKHDPETANAPLTAKLINAAHHQGAAHEKGVRCFGTGFAFTEPAANIVWATNKFLGSDCWMITLKDRLGLPEHILKSLPNEEDIIGKAYGFERRHPELFDGTQTVQLGIFFSEETKFHTFFGSIENGYARDYSAAVRLLMSNGITSRTVFTVPTDTKEYPLLLIPDAAVLTKDEIASLRLYTKNGGRLIVSGPSALPEADDQWELPNRAAISCPADFFCSMDGGHFPKSPNWLTKTPLPECTADIKFKECAPSVFYTPHRISSNKVTDELLDLIRKNMKPMPIPSIKAEGYLINIFEHEDSFTVHLLCADYDTDIDHKLDEMRYHRSRVNFINKVEPIGVSQRIVIEAKGDITVFTPFDSGEASLLGEDDNTVISLPQPTAYVIVKIRKQITV